MWHLSMYFLQIKILFGFFCIFFPPLLVFRKMLLSVGLLKMLDAAFFDTNKLAYKCIFAGVATLKHQQRWKNKRTRN